MKLETLMQVNVERAARRPVIVITDTGNGEQRLVKAKDIAADPLRAGPVLTSRQACVNMRVRKRRYWKRTKPPAC